ncbi:MAG: hypothetical protein Q9181_007410 [Wetmoreana brouardii]
MIILKTFQQVFAVSVLFLVSILYLVSFCDFPTLGPANQAQEGSNRSSSHVNSAQIIHSAAAANHTTYDPFFVQQGGLLAKRAYLTQQAAFCEGEKILERILSHAATSPSAFTTQKDLENNGWTIKPSVPQVFSPAFEKPFTDLGLTPGPYRNPKQSALQDKSFLNIKNQVRPPVNSEFTNTFSPRNGVIIANLNVNPRSKIVTDAQLRKPPRHLTKTEIAEACKGANEDPGSLKHIFRDTIATPDTQNVMEEVLGENPMDPHLENYPWPGRTFKMDDPTGVALLGTAHGKGVAWLLIKNRHQIQKDIKEVTIFSYQRKEEGRQIGLGYYMMFTLT